LLTAQVNRRAGDPALIPVRLSGGQDAGLPEAAAALIDHVDSLALPPGATAEVTEADGEHGGHPAVAVDGAT